MPSADQVPVITSHSTMRWHKWVVLTAGSTGSALRAVRPPNLHIRPAVRRDLVYAASATAVTFVGRRAREPGLMPDVSIGPRKSSTQEARGHNWASHHVL